LRESGLKNNPNISSRKKIWVAIGCFGLLLVVALYFWQKQGERNSRGMPPALLCRLQLREIQAAKDQWGYFKNKTTNDAPTWDDILPYLHGEKPVCPSGGAYILGKIGEPVKCSYPGHALE
jgi:hypothetical protein